MAYSAPTADFVTSTLSGALATAGTSATIGTGLNLPATNGVLHVDYDSTTAVGVDEGPETIAYTSYTSGTGALAGLTRGIGGTTDVAHNSGSKVSSGMSSVYFGSGSQAQDVRSILNPYKARAYPSASQTGVADAAWTTVTLNTESYDINSNFDTGTYKYTVPVTGYYQINAQIVITGTGVATYGAGISLNGAATPDLTKGTSLGAGTSSRVASLSGTFYLTATNTIELKGYADVASGTGTFTGGTAATYMDVHLLSI